MAGETKQQRFKRVAQKRVQRVLDGLRGLSQCANKRMYQWDEAALKKMWNAIDKELQLCKDSFEESKPDEFTF
jgi:hypothetical protein